MSARKNRNGYEYNDQVRSDAAIAVLTKNASENDSKGTLACALPWGHGWGWATLPNGVWSGGKLQPHRTHASCLRVKLHFCCIILLYF